MTDASTCPANHPHDKFNTCYRVHGCRCRPCKNRSARMKALERERHKAGTHKAMRSPKPTVRHLKGLVAGGMLQRDIARASGLNEATIHRLLHDRPLMVFPQTERAVLAVRLDASPVRAPRAWVTSPGSVRRVQALMALGYASPQIGAMVGRHPEWAQRLVNDGSGRIEERTRQALVEAFDRHSMIRPVGVYADRTRRWASGRGYLPPLSWDNIDDPLEEPETTKHVRPTGAEVLADVGVLLDAGESPEQVSVIVQRSPGAIAKLAERYGQRTIANTYQALAKREGQAA